jgi:hypothetical protein
MNKMNKSRSNDDRLNEPAKKRTPPTGATPVTAFKFLEENHGRCSRAVLGASITKRLMAAGARGSGPWADRVLL